MSNFTNPRWKGERLGLSMIAASLLTIVLITGLLFDYLRDSREERVRAQGISLIRVLTTLPFHELVPASNPAAVLTTLKVNENKDDFAYATVVDTTGKPIVELAADGVLVPHSPLPAQPSAWLGERLIEAEGRQAPVLEFHAPLLANGELAGHLRLGYFQPGFGLTPTQMAFLATLALIIFLLTPLFYFLVRREIRPLEAVGSNLGDLLEQGSMRPLEVAATGEFGQFMNNFNKFINYANQRVADVESEQERMLTSTKLLSYRKDRILRVLESLPDAILLLDEAGTITVANRHLETTLGVKAKDVTGSASLDWCTQPQVHSFLSSCRAGGHYLPEPLEFVTDAAPGTTYLMTAYPLFLPDEAKTIGCLVIVRDATVEAMARRGRAEFVAHVAHEFKTPLNVLSMYSQTLQTLDADDAETRVEAANVIEEEVGRMSLLINNMLNITKIEMGSLDIDSQHVRIRDLLEDVFANIKHTRQAGELKFELDLPTQITPLEVDKDLLRIVLNNLLTNAVKYNRPGGKVTLSAEEKDKVVCIRVADTGLGIGAEDLPLIFEKFYRSEDDDIRARPGHGLGLALARDIVELHNGSIRVESTPGVGTVFQVELWKHANTMQQVV